MGASTVVAKASLLYFDLSFPKEFWPDSALDTLSCHLEEFERSCQCCLAYFTRKIDSVAAFFDASPEPNELDFASSIRYD
jgi:hypothetical protein